MLTSGSKDNPVPAPAPVFVIGSLVVACCARVARCPEPGESLSATGFIMEAGGKGFNVALAAHRMGVPLDGVFAVGDDPAGALMRQAFAGQGLDESLIHIVDTPTGAGVGLIQEDGENRIVVYPGANARLSAEHVLHRAEGVRGAGIVFAQYEAPDAPIAAAFAMARAAGVMTILNPSPYRPISAEILASTDLLVVNAQEVAALASDRLWTGGWGGLATSLMDAGVAGLVVTQGAEGVSGWWRGERVDHPAFSVDVVDSIGAGDAFSGAMIAALAHREDFATALRWGSAAGAWVASRLGFVEALPDRAALDRMLESG